MFLEIVYCIIVVVIVGFVVLPNEYKGTPFPHPDECWDCNKGNCKGCAVIKRGGN